MIRSEQSYLQRSLDCKYFYNYLMTNQYHVVNEPKNTIHQINRVFLKFSPAYLHYTIPCQFFFILFILFILFIYL
jgi:hypothetical protein